jgi:hypothetical protein
MVKRQLERARNFEREQERRLLEAYARGPKRRRENKGRDRRERERTLLGTYDYGHKKRRERRGASVILLRKLVRSARR